MGFFLFCLIGFAVSQNSSTTGPEATSTAPTTATPQPTIPATGCTLFSQGPTACSKCIQMPGCGWCSSQRRCVEGTAVGPTSPLFPGGVPICIQGWVFGNDTSFCPNCLSRQGCIECSRYPDCIFCNYTANPNPNANTGCYDRADPPSNCTVPLTARCQCHLHQSCKACTNQEGSCYWCEAKKRCFSKDQGLAPGCQSNETCPTCEAITQCQNCLQTPGCGWCGSSCKSSDACNSQSNPPAIANCDSYCRLQTSCEPCIFSQGCGWCPELSRCEGTDMVKLQPCKQFAIYCPRPASFDAGSFFGGAALVVGLGAAAVISFFVIKRFRRSNYSQL